MAGEATSRSTRRSPRSARRSSGAQQGETVTYTLPNGKDAEGRDRRRRALRGLTVRLDAVLDDVVAVLAQPAEHAARRARTPRVSSCSRTSTSPMCRVVRGALVRHLEHVGARLGELGEQARQPAGTVGDVHLEVQVAPARGQAVPDQLAEQQRVDVAAREHRDDRGARSAVGWSISAATAAAPDGSTTILARSSSITSARDIDSSETVTTSSTYFWIAANGTSPGLRDRDAVGHRRHLLQRDRARPARSDSG